MTKQVATHTALQDLLAIMARLRDPETGCPWDIVQTFETIAPHTIEEAYEVAEAIRKNDMVNLKEELGDLLLQVVFHARMAEEAGIFDFHDVVTGLSEKLVSRHPHVFGDKSAEKPSDVDVLWEQQKDLEKQRKGTVPESILDDVALALPAIMRAQKLQKRAAKVGFEWEKPEDVLTKLEEEIAETHAAIGSGDAKAIHEEIGDMLFCVVNYGRMLDVDCERALRDCNDKFLLRFKGIEATLKSRNKRMEDTTLEEMEALWQEQKQKKK